MAGTDRSNPPKCACPDGYLDKCGENTYAYGGNDVNNGYGSVKVGVESRCTDGTCEKCAPACLSCSGSIDNCTSCANGRENVPSCDCPDG